MKLSKIIRGYSEKGFLMLRPKGFKHRIKIRKNYTDREVVEYVLQDKYHLPPSEVTLSESPIILDLGTNIGLTIAHFKELYPNASVYGFEMNPENYKLALYNTRVYKNVSIANKAVWIDNAGITYASDASYDSFAIDRSTKQVESNVTKVPSITISEIIKAHGLKKIDYIKMDIEGAEEDILDQEDVSWLDIVEVLNIEMHFEQGDDRIKEYMSILEQQGFDVRESDAHWSSIFAVRKTS
ncbi:FkbM family methyltransferase [uncultured Dokdonia sp.]|uniref:FkbM family methyltransferase n=1 Tax=uncultured Dokdonia sp. TaxID=575653 RepID=UPI0030EF8160